MIGIGLSRFVTNLLRSMTKGLALERSIGNPKASDLFVERLTKRMKTTRGIQTLVMHILL